MPVGSDMNMNADTRLYGTAIALVSGVYSITSAIAGGMAMRPVSSAVMLVVGVIVIVHGLALLTPVAERLGRASGLLMILWAAIMLGNQALAATMTSGRMTGEMAWDGGMVAVAVLMLASGLIMSRRM